MKTIKLLSLPLLLLLLTSACQKDKETDTQKPVIDLSFAEAFPINCDTLYFGQSFLLKLKLSDNVQLGSYSIEIHNNFDHHSHSTEVTHCTLDPKKEAVNPYLLIGDYTIPEGLQEYETNLSVNIPAGNTSGLFDEGDYHFFISLTDHEGWSDQKGLSIKLLHQ